MSKATYRNFKIDVSPTHSSLPYRGIDFCAHIEGNEEMGGYDNWLTHNPDEDRCEFCGVHDGGCRAGWQPEDCTGECGRRWRDPDAEYDRMRDEGEAS